MTSALPPELEAVTEPIPVLTRRPRWRDTFAPLGAYNYRLYLIASLFANTGGWMARVAIDWLVLELTGDVALVGLAVALQFAPTLLLGPWAGVLSDRASRRIVLLCTMSVGAVANAVLAVLVLTGSVATWHVLLIAGITGISMAIDGPSRSAFVSEMVGTHRLRGAISLNATVFHLAGLLGPAISGILIVAIGSGWSIMINACTSLVAVVAFVFMRTRELVPAMRQPRSRGQIREALRYVWGKPTIVWPLVLLAFVAVFGMNLPVLLAAAADEGWHTGAAGYGLYNSLCAAGAFVGALLSSRRRMLRLRDIVAFAGLYGAVTMLAGVVNWYPMFLSALLGIGVARLLFATGAESMTQLSTNLGIRGRVMSLYIMVVMGGQAAGGVIMGWIAENLGSSWAFIIAGGMPALAAGVVAIVLAWRRELRLRVDFRSPRRFVRIVPREVAAA
jgi:MFS family permease